jgi:hypothetical protein
MTMEDILVIAVLIFSQVIVFIILRKIYNAIFAPKRESSYSDATGLDFSKLKKISSRPFLLGLENKFIDEEELYFDDRQLYAVDRQIKLATFNLENIASLERTSVKINNRTIWKLNIDQADGQMVVFKFAHNFTLWNKSFPEFYELIRAINPQAIKSTWSVWRM